MGVNKSMVAIDHFAVGEFMNWIKGDEELRKKFIKYGNNFEVVGYAMSLKFFYLYNEMISNKHINGCSKEKEIHFNENENTGSNMPRKVKLKLYRRGFFSIRLGENDIFIDMPMMGPIDSDYSLSGLAYTFRYFACHPFTEFIMYVYNNYGIGNGRLEGNTVEIMKFLFNWNIEFNSSEGEIYFMSTLYKYNHYQAVKELFGIYNEG